MENYAIVALSTPPGESGIAVVRISGSSAARILDAMAPGASLAPSRTLTLVTLNDGSGEPIDEALVAVMRAPASYTGEDMVEISCHGSMQVVSDLVDEIARLGARLATPGEFTKRAFLNGRLDLAQAEAVVDLISAETKLQRKIALEQLGGAISRKVRALEEALLDELALIEASIDFSEEDLPARAPRETLEAARRARASIAALLESEVAGERLRRGLRVTILGAATSERAASTTRSSARNGRSSPPSPERREICFAKGSTSAASRAASRIRPASPKRTARSRRRESRSRERRRARRISFCSSWTEAEKSRTRREAKFPGSRRRSFSACSTRATSGRGIRARRRAGCSARGTRSRSRRSRTRGSKACGRGYSKKR